MKYSIEGFSQEYAMTLKKTVEVKGKKVVRQIDCTDLVILRWFVDFHPNMKKIEVDGKQYAWLTHNRLIEDLPLIDINKRAFIDRMQKLVDFGILTYKLLKDGGTFSLYGFGENYKNLIASNDIGCTVEQHRGMRSNDIGVCGQTTNKDNSIKDTSIKDNNIIAVIDYLNEKAGTRFRSVESNAKYINARLKDGYTVYDLKAVIDKKVKEWKGTDFQRFLRPETLFNATKFETYLNGLEAVKKTEQRKDDYLKHDYTKEQLDSVVITAEKLEEMVRLGELDPDDWGD